MSVLYRRGLLALAVFAFVLPGAHVQAAAPIPVYIFAGQSNMVGTATLSSLLPGIAPKLSAPQHDVLFFGPTADLPRRWAAIEPPTEVFSAMFHQGFGPELSAAQALTALHPHTRIAILKVARTATNLYRDWDPRRCCMYRKTVERARYALAVLSRQMHAPVRVAGMLWMQGESDSNTRAHAEAYATNLERLIAAFRAEFRAPTMPFVIGQISDVRKYYPKLLPYSAVVRAKQLEVTRATPHTFIVSTDGLQHAHVSPIHYNTQGTVDLGRRFVRREFGL